MQRHGFVSLVGAGPGDPGLITVKGRDRLGAADAVVYDRLAHPALLDYAPAAADRIYSGKADGAHALEQDQINALLVLLGSDGKRVVRLKGGDPFVFGRGGEEATALAQARIPFEIVPGISSGIAAAAYAGIPVTDRRFASSVTFVSGHRHPDDPASPVDWAGVATSADTLVIFMGMRHLHALAETLIAQGRPPGTPAAVVQWGTHDDQRSVVASLEHIARESARLHLGSPAVVVVGEVVSLHEDLAWFGEVARGGHEADVAAAGRLWI